MKNVIKNQKEFSRIIMRDIKPIVEDYGLGKMGPVQASIITNAVVSSANNRGKSGCLNRFHRELDNLCSTQGIKLSFNTVQCQVITEELDKLLRYRSIPYSNARKSLKNICLG